MNTIYNQSVEYTLHKIVSEKNVNPYIPLNCKSVYKTVALNLYYVVKKNNNIYNST